ncbi:MAG TPA: secretin N-terminal domain-containing protein [Burkholderiaceae bacterium]|nr:secretin N-terminal domain-containing protein [Burkholderiaceae bacterium]
MRKMPIVIASALAMIATGAACAVPLAGDAADEAPPPQTAAVAAPGSPAAAAPAAAPAVAQSSAAPRAVVPPPAATWSPAVPAPRPDAPISLALRDVSVQEVFEMLSRLHRVNIMLSKGVNGTVSVNLYDVTIEQAIVSLAEAAGYAVERRHGGYMIVDRKDAGLDTAAGNTQVRSFKVQYSEPKQVATILTKHLSRYGKITPLPERKMLVVEDTPEFMDRIERLLREIDVQPRQILIEAKILEIALESGESFGIDWSRVFSANGGTARIGTTGFARGSAGAPTTGFFFNLVNRNIELFLSALSEKGRVHTLSTPKLLALEHQEAQTKIGDNIGYRVTTTIANVTTESIQFLETGVILRVTPSVDEQGRILMRIHPEVSSGSVSLGIPSKRSTEVTTTLVAEDGQSILIGGLIQHSASLRRNGVPLLSDLPGIGLAFSNTEQTGSSRETVVMITPRIVHGHDAGAAAAMSARIEATNRLLLERSASVARTLGWPATEESGSLRTPAQPSLSK